MKKFILIIIVFSTIASVYSQEVITPDSSNTMTVYDIQRNSVHAELISVYFLSGFYEKIIPIGNRSALIAGVGLTQGLGENTQDLPVKIAFIWGGIKHFVECGTHIHIIKDSHSDLGRILPLAGYRFQSKAGFLFRAALMVNPVKEIADVTGEEHLEIMPGLALSIGYSF